MALSYTESAQLMNDPTFRGRVKVCCLKFSDSIMNEGSNIPAHNTRMKWAAQCAQQPDQIANQITPPVTMDAAVQAAGSQITDDDLQAAVESVINKLM